eukprot:TRINITY_DN4956_c0_g2_i2.p1 TRINITY_DN4956_c0_g2~~TRINITY_DN4956_c0_g2_i2.p1  ORF type:complete len:278 (+),score=53.55 TRINITY_DN4956_c0_g2_i2:448-1281(+)
MAVAHSNRTLLPDVACQIQSTMILFFTLASMLWSSGFCFSLIYTPEDHSATVNRITKFLLFGICWGYPLCVTCYSLISGHFGQGPIWCWIEEQYWKDRVYLFFLILFISFIFDMGAFGFVVWKVRPSDLALPINRPEGSIDASIRRRMLIFVLGYIFSWSGACANRLWQINHEPVFILEFWEASTISLQGFINAIIYGANPRGRKLMRSFLENIRKKLWTSRDFVIKGSSEKQLLLTVKKMDTSIQQPNSDLLLVMQDAQLQQLQRQKHAIEHQQQT